MKYKTAKPYFYETLETQCPYCGSDYIGKDIGWRDKYFNPKTGISAYEFRCQKTACGKIFKLNHQVLFPNQQSSQW